MQYVCKNIYRWLRNKDRTFGGGYLSELMENGKVFGFNYTEKELCQRIQEYKDLSNSGDIRLPSWPDFCCFVDCDSDTLEEVMNQGVKMTGNVRSAYYSRAMALKSMRRWCEAQLVSNPNWGGSMGVKSMMLLNRDSVEARSTLTSEPTSRPDRRRSLSASAAVIREARRLQSERTTQKRYFVAFKPGCSPTKRTE
jgi:hypothetical protein